MALGPFHPAVSHSDEDLTQVDHFLRDPYDRGSGEHPIHRPVTSCAALRQLPVRKPYTRKTIVATRLRRDFGIDLPLRVFAHTVALNLENSRFSLRFFDRSHQIAARPFADLSDANRLFLPTQLTARAQPRTATCNTCSPATLEVSHA